MQMGDAIYNELLPIINELIASENIEVPTIDSFKPLNLDRYFDTDESLDMYHSIKNNDVDTLFKKPKSFPFRVIKGGLKD